jgi:hypothetical protein
MESKLQLLRKIKSLLEAFGGKQNSISNFVIEKIIYNVNLNLF